MESDSLSIVNAIKSRQVDNYVFGLLIFYCISLIQEISNCTMLFVRSSMNKMTHVLTKSYASMSGLGA